MPKDMLITRRGFAALLAGSASSVILFQVGCSKSNGQENARIFDFALDGEEIQPDGTYQMSGNRIRVEAFGLSQPFEAVRAQLDAIAEAHFAKEAIAV